MMFRDDPLPPSLGELPGRVADEICVILDSSVEHNWIKLLEDVPEYTHMDVLELRNLSHRGVSPTRELLKNLNGQGWNVVQLGQAARRAGIIGVVNIISSFCEEEGIAVDFQESSPASDRNHVAAKSCLVRSKYPTELEPPITEMEEARRRYNLPHSPAPPPYSEIESHRNAAPLRECVDKTSPVAQHGKSETSNSNASRQKANNVHCQDNHDTDNQPMMTLPTSSKTTPSETTGTLSATPVLFNGSLTPPPDNLEEVRYDVLMEATQNFDRTPYKAGGHKVGEGGFGEVFQCLLLLRSGPVHAAVKVLLNKNELSLSANSLDSVGRKQFSTEMQALSKLSHKCLLPVLGFSYDGPQLCLIYPFMSNGSLEAHLPNHTTLPPHTRLTVATDIASGLRYLHFEVESTIVHRDIKSANVLLTEDWRGRLGDFGLARLLPSQQEQSCGGVVHTATIVGTRVYMAPETNHGKVTPAADVYALGVVLFELLTGRCALSNIATDDGEETDLVTYIEELEDDRESELIVGGWEERVWLKVWQIAKRCLLHYKKRPTSAKVLEDIMKLSS